jgi:hypothetical protein
MLRCVVSGAMGRREGTGRGVISTDRDRGSQRHLRHWRARCNIYTQRAGQPNTTGLRQPLARSVAGAGRTSPAFAGAGRASPS